MRLFGHWIAILVALLSFTALATAGEYYDRFLATGITNNDPRIRRIPALVDTNNTGLKLTNLIETLKHSRGRGALAGIRLGMTMEEVAATFGKPPFLFPSCAGGRRLCYTDLSVIFDPTNNAAIRILIEEFPHSRDAPSPALTVGECIGIFGQPTSRTEGYHDLIYDSPSERLELRFVQGALTWALLERPGLRKK
jgi:hypothetical protein